jgi:hypothetical protein
LFCGLTLLPNGNAFPGTLHVNPMILDPAVVAISTGARLQVGAIVRRIRPLRQTRSGRLPEMGFSVGYVVDRRR